jgi:hypothetical protein
MPNTNPQAIAIANDKIRPLADRIGQAYNLCKALQAESAAEGWGALFAGGAANTIVDGSAVDGRAPITDADVVAVNTFVSAFVTFMEQSANANRNLILRVAVAPERL